MDPVIADPLTLPEPYWLTRDRVGGDLVDDVDIWVVMPVRQHYEDGDVIWFPPSLEGADVADSCVGYWTVAMARTAVGNGVPETDRECLRVGRGKRG